MQDSRRAGGQAMIDRRAGKSDVDDINALVNPPRQQRALKTVEPRGGLPAQRGSGAYVAPPANTGGGIASPLTETANTRTFHESVIRTSMDGAVFFEVRAAKTVTMTDANGAEVIMEYANVTA
ncbi:hypothetical protein [Phytopseudomonas punonensis]|nr:hypothetical protein [Pseudomonas punonensis]